jgi:hypothetical protein
MGIMNGKRSKSMFSSYPPLPHQFHAFFFGAFRKSTPRATNRELHLDRVPSALRAELPTVLWVKKTKGRLKKAISYRLHNWITTRNIQILKDSTGHHSEWKIPTSQQGNK